MKVVKINNFKNVFAWVSLKGDLANNPFNGVDITTELHAIFNQTENINFKCSFLIAIDNKADKLLLLYSEKYVLIYRLTSYRLFGLVDISKNQLLTTSDCSVSINNVVLALEKFQRLQKRHKDIFESYITNQTSKKLCTFIGVRQIMHNLIEEVSGIWRSLDTTTPHYIFTDFEYYGKHEKLFESKLQPSVLFLRNKTIEEIFIKTCTENLFFYKPTCTKVQPELLQHIINLNTVQHPKETFNKKFLFTIRTTKRLLLNQVEFISKMIDVFNIKYPGSIFYIDGITQLNNSWVPQDHIWVQREQEIYDQIKNQIKSTVDIRSLIYKTLPEYITAVSDLDFYVAHVGTLQHKLGFFSPHSKGVIHGGDLSHFSKTDPDGWYWSGHFGKTCRKIDINCFTYQPCEPGQGEYQASYIANIPLCKSYFETLDITLSVDNIPTVKENVPTASLPVVPYCAFDEIQYLTDYPDIQGEPYEHYIKYGMKEGRKMSIRIPIPYDNFNSEQYLLDNIDVEGDAYEHYVKYGWVERRKAVCKDKTKIPQKCPCLHYILNN